MSHRRVRVRWKTLTTVAVAVIPVLFASWPAFAQSRKEMERTARKACLNGDYSKGVSILSDLFVDTKDPTYIYNQGRCFEQNRRFEDAVAKFEEYLRTDLSAQSRAAGEKHLAESQKKLAQERENTLTQPMPFVAPPPVSTSPVSPKPKTKVERTAAPTVNESPAPSEPGRRRWGLITGGIVAASLGVGAAVAGLLFQLKANSMVKDWESKPGTYSTSNEDKQKNYRTLTWVGYGAGAALITTGTILMAVGASSRTSSSGNVALSPSVGPAQFGAMLTGSF
jgi:hypothetical protein